MRDLFDDSPSPVSQYLEALDLWTREVKARGLMQQQSTIKAHATIWTHFSRWCVGQARAIPLASITLQDLETYLMTLNSARQDDSGPSGRHVWRVLKTIDRIVNLYCRSHQLPAWSAATELLQRNPDWRYALSAAKDPLPEYLPADQARLLVNYLARYRVDAGAARLSWHELRNRCAVALQLGAGLTPSDVRALGVDSVITAGGPVAGQPWKLIVPEHGAAASRETPLAKWAGALLQRWMRTRAEVDIDGHLLFPSTRAGKPWSKVAQYKAVSEVLEASGIDAALVPGGSFRLRHTFALRQLRRGHTREDVARWLGLSGPLQLRRYGSVLYGPVPDLA